MNAIRLPTFTRLATFTLLSSRVIAQTELNNNGTNENQCPLNVHRDFNSNAPINSTGSVNIHWNALMMDPARNDWIFTLTYNESRGSDTQHFLQAYISAPEASEAQACVHMFGGLNATWSSSRRNGCDGILNDVCFDFLSNKTFSSSCSIPEPRTEWLEDLREVCGDDVATSLVSTNAAQDFTNTTCTIDRPPGSTSPDNYRTWAAIGRTSINTETGDSDPASFIRYDQYVRQTIPFLVTANFLGGVTETQVVCVAPKKVIKGGRTPGSTSAASQNWRYTTWVAAIISSLTVGAFNIIS